MATHPEVDKASVASSEASTDSPPHEQSQPQSRDASYAPPSLNATAPPHLEPTPSSAAVDEKTQAMELTRTQSRPLPPKRVVIPIMLCIYAAIFLVALDRTIIGVAIPTLSNQFDSFDDIGWYGSAFFMTTCCFQLLMGKIYTFYNVKWVYMACISIFEVASLLCAVSPNSVSFIWGRAIQGVGAAGIISGSVAIMVAITPLKDRPMWMGLVGAFMGIASVVGPLLGGAFTTNVSWRWCFYINLPIGGVVMVMILIFLKSSEALERKPPHWREQVKRLDPLGNILFMPAVVCLLLALQWGGTKYPWSDGRIISLLVVFGVLLILWFASQVYQKEYATLPLHVMKNQTILAGFWMVIMTGSAMLTITYWLPTWFQAIKGASAAHAGVMNIPLILSLVIASTGSGIFIRKIGYYTPNAILCSIVASAGAGLFQLWTPSTNHPMWIGAQFLFGFGLGLGQQQPSLAAQVVLDKKDVNTGVALMFFGQTLGGALFVSVGQNLLDNRLSKSLSDIPGINPKLFETSGATDFQKLIPEQYRTQALQGYNDAMVDVFAIGVATAAASILGSALLPWKSVKPKSNGKPADANAAEGKSEESTQKKEDARDASEKV
ncbi:MAG: hypothetical protein Q9159_000416 [Coniocarpon cinnabarinum]